MEETREISALFHLIDDPDREVFTTVSERIYTFGKPIIPNLENLWENTPDEDVQERIEMLIHRLHFRELSQEMEDWKKSEEQDLLTGALLVSKFQYPEIALAPVMKEIEKIKRNIWLELTNYLTALEQANVVTTILNSFYNLKGVEVSYKEPNDFLLNKVLDTKKGNSISNGILYLIMGSLLDIPIRAVNIPRQLFWDFLMSIFITGKMLKLIRWKISSFLLILPADRSTRIKMWKLILKNYPSLSLPLISNPSTIPGLFRRCSNNLQNVFSQKKTCTNTMNCFSCLQYSTNSLA